MAVSTRPCLTTRGSIGLRSSRYVVSAVSFHSRLSCEIYALRYWTGIESRSKQYQSKNCTGARPWIIFRSVVVNANRSAATNLDFNLSATLSAHWRDLCEHRDIQTPHIHSTYHHDYCRPGDLKHLNIEIIPIANTDTVFNNGAFSLGMEIPCADRTCVSDDVRLWRNGRCGTRNHQHDRVYCAATSHGDGTSPSPPQPRACILMNKSTAHSRDRTGSTPWRANNQHRRPHIPHPPRPRKSQPTSHIPVLERCQKKRQRQ